MRGSLATVSLLVAMVCFAVALLLGVGIVHGTATRTWNTAGLLLVVLALLLGHRE